MGELIDKIQRENTYVLYQEIIIIFISYFNGTLTLSTESGKAVNDLENAFWYIPSTT